RIEEKGESAKVTRFGPTLARADDSQLPTALRPGFDRLRPSRGQGPQAGDEVRLLAANRGPLQIRHSVEELIKSVGEFCCPSAVEGGALKEQRGEHIDQAACCGLARRAPTAEPPGLVTQAADGIDQRGGVGPR